MVFVTTPARFIFILAWIAPLKVPKIEKVVGTLVDVKLLNLAFESLIVACVLTGLKLYQVSEGVAVYVPLPRPVKLYSPLTSV